MVDLGVYFHHLAQVAHAYRFAGPVRVLDVAHHHVGDVADGAIAGHAAQLEDSVVVLQGAGRHVGVLRTQAILQHCQRYAVGIETVAIHRDANLLFPPACHTGFGDAGQLFQGRRHLPTRQAAQFGKIRPPVWCDQAQGENRRLARVEAPHQHLVDRRIPFDGANRLLYIHQGDVQIHIPVENHGGHQAPGAADLGHLADATHGEQLLFQPFAVQPLHLRRRPVAGAYRHYQRRALQIRQQIHGQIVPRKPTYQSDCESDHGDRDRTAHRRASKPLEGVHNGSNRPPSEQSAIGGVAGVGTSVGGFGLVEGKGRAGHDANCVAR